MAEENRADGRAAVEKMTVARPVAQCQPSSLIGYGTDGPYNVIIVVAAGISETSATVGVIATGLLGEVSSMLA